MSSQNENLLSKFQDRINLSRHIIPFTKRNKTREISSQNTICLFCTPRGGSTWLAEILLNIPNTVLIDEPLWRGEVNIPFEKPDYFRRKITHISELYFFYNQHIPEKEKWDRAHDVIEDILAGRAISLGLYNEQKLSRLKNNGIYITKFCYANLLMPWLLNQFDLKAILLTRHPCAVVASQLRLPSWKNINVQNFSRIADFPFNQVYHNALEKAGNINSREKYLALIWAMGFANTAMHNENNKRWMTISYERLLIDYHQEMERISSRYLIDISFLEKDNKKPSKSTKPNSFVNIKDGQQLSSWKKELSKKQISIILNVLEKFEIDIYSEKLEPDFDKLYSK